MKIIFFETTEEEKKVLPGLLEGLDAVFLKEKLTLQNVGLAAEAEIVSVFVNSEISKEIIDLLPKAKLFATRSTGYDHVDISYAKEKGIAVCNIPSYGSKTVAEFAFALMLDLSRKISKASNQLRENASFDISNFRGFDLNGKTLGVVGTGRIGKNVIKIANCFGMKIAAYDVFPDAKFAEENNFKYLSLDEVLAESDIVTLHTPYNKETYHLINKKNISLFKNGAYLINTARGEIVETEALIDALKDGRLAGAGIDVLEGERKLKEEKKLLSSGGLSADHLKLIAQNHELINMTNVIVTPHIAFFSAEAEAEIVRSAADNIGSFVKGNPQNIL